MLYLFLESTLIETQASEQESASRQETVNESAEVVTPYIPSEPFYLV